MASGQAVGRVVRQAVGQAVDVVAVTVVGGVMPRVGAITTGHAYGKIVVAVAPQIGGAIAVVGS